MRTPCRDEWQGVLVGASRIDGARRLLEWIHPAGSIRRSGYGQAGRPCGSAIVQLLVSPLIVMVIFAVLLPS